MVSDANGEDDINDVDMTLYRSAVTNACSADVNDCYIVSNCSLTANDSDSKYYSCTADIAYYADSTGAGGPYPAQTWEAKVKVNDKNSGTGNSTKTNMEVATLLSLNIPETGIAYGTLASNTSTVASNNQEMTITQYGNDEADVLVSGTDMSCSGLGYIPSGEQEWSLTDTDHSATNNTDLAPTAVDTDLNVGYRTDGAVSKILYWNINVPYGNVGTCTGTNTITALAH